MAHSQRVRDLWPDHLGLARGKYVPAHLAARAVNHCVGVFGQGFHRGITRAPGAGFEEGFPDLVAPANTDVRAPEDLAAALTALEADIALVDAVGGELVANFVGIKRAEWERFTAASRTGN